jgi:hypothetical protein
MLDKIRNYVIAWYIQLQARRLSQSKLHNKEFGYRNNRGTQRQWCIPKFTPLRVLTSIGAVWRHKAPQTPWRLTIISSSPPTKMKDPTTMGHLRAVTEPIQAWGNLHNSIGGSQKSPLRHHKAWEDLHNLIGGTQVIATEAPQSLRRYPQLNWRSPSNH